MRRITGVLLISLLFSFIASAQNTGLIDENGLFPSPGSMVKLKNGDNIIEATADAYNNATAIPFSFTRSLIQGKFIDDNMKGRASERMKNFNYQEFGYNGGISWYHKWSDSSFFRNGVTSV